MGWISDFIQCVVSILSCILGLWIPDAGDHDYREHGYEFTCADARWLGSPEYKQGYFDGDVEVLCQFKISEGGNLIELHHLLTEQVSAKSQAVHDEQVLNYRGMPGIRYDHTIDLSTPAVSNLVRGLTHIATDGFTKLSSVFKAAPQQSARAIYGAEHIALEAHVERISEENDFRLTMRNHVFMQKPWMISPARFTSEVMIQSEDRLEKRANDLVQWIAANL